ncbi:hypothetical protein FB446DRAFT_21186 [Lentinula raphanica]|nr:hypothetical protein FB446DRAFT_21186 [Lentinula raphanica]
MFPAFLFHRSRCSRSGSGLNPWACTLAVLLVLELASLACAGPISIHTGSSSVPQSEAGAGVSELLSPSSSSLRPRGDRTPAYVQYPEGSDYILPPSSSSELRTTGAFLKIGGYELMASVGIPQSKNSGGQLIECLVQCGGHSNPDFKLHVWGTAEKVSGELFRIPGLKRVLKIIDNKVTEDLRQMYYKDGKC